MGLNNLLLLEHVHVSVMFSAKCLFHLLKQTTLLGLEQETPTKRLLLFCGKKICILQRISRNILDKTQIFVIEIMKKHSLFVTRPMHTPSSCGKPLQPIPSLCLLFLAASFRKLRLLTRDHWSAGSMHQGSVAVRSPHTRSLCELA